MLKNIVARTKEEKKVEIRKIITKLSQLHLSPNTNEGIKTLYENMKLYIEEDNSIDINIECPELNIRIRGVLEVDNNKQIWLKMECLVKPEE